MRIRERIILYTLVLKQATRPPWHLLIWTVAAIWLVSEAKNNFYSEWVPEDAKSPRSLEVLTSWWNALPWSGWALIAALVVLVWMIVFAARQEMRIRTVSLDERLPTSGTWLLPWWRRAPIIWSNHDHFLIVSSHGSVVSRMSREMADEWKADPDFVGRHIQRIVRFQLYGRNRLSVPLLLEAAHLEVLGTSESIPVKVNGRDVNGVRIDPGAAFILTADFPSTEGKLASGGVPIRTFRERYPYLVLRVRTGRGAFTQEFTQEDITQHIKSRLVDMEAGRKSRLVDMEAGRVIQRPAAHPTK